MVLASNVLRHLKVRPRLTTAVCTGIALTLALPHTLAAATRALIAWDVGAGLYLVLAWITMSRASVERMRVRAREQDEGAAVILVLAIFATIASFAAIVFEVA